MKHVSINCLERTFTLTVLTSPEEVTADFLRDVTKHVAVAPYYSLIALICKDEANMLINTNKKSQPTVGVIPVFVTSPVEEINENDRTPFMTNITTGNKIIIAPSDVAIGHHVSIPDNPYSVNTIITAIKLDKSSFFKAGEIGTVYTVDFKIVPNSAIKGYYKS